MKKLDEFEHFQSLTDAGKTQLQQGVTEVKLPSSTAVLHRGQHIAGAYFVLSGQLRVYSLSPNGTEATLYTINPGETCVFALNCLFNDLLYPAWVRAEADTEVAVVNGETYRKLFQSEQSIQNITVQSLSTIVFRLMAELEQVHTCSQSQRLANLILIHANSHDELHMTQQQMANHLGTTREVVARLVGQFVAAGYIRSQRGLIVILNKQPLNEIVTAID